MTIFLTPRKFIIGILHSTKSRDRRPNHHRCGYKQHLTLLFNNEKLLRSNMPRNYQEKTRSRYPCPVYLMLLLKASEFPRGLHFQLQTISEILWSVRSMREDTIISMVISNKSLTATIHFTRQLCSLCRKILLYFKG